MSQHRLGRDEAARDSFNRALLWIQDAERTGGMHWTEWLETQALRREADALLGTQRLVP